MREIKFRGWHSGLKYMWHDVQDAYDSNELCARCFGDMLRDENYTVMQYTGLKDKNGKEIFEGDIVQEISVHGEVKRWCVRWVNTPYSAFFDFGYMSPAHMVEIVGNIYENPELLE